MAVPLLGRSPSGVGVEPTMIPPARVESVAGRYGVPEQIFTDNGKVFASIEDAQAQLDVWVEHYDHERPHQSLGMMTPWDRFKLPRNEPAAP